MSYLLLKHYYKGKKYKINYIINELKLLKIFLGRLNKKGYKNMSYFILAKVLYFLKKNIELEPKIMFKMIINKIKPCILLFNKKRGTVIFELPRFLTFEQSFKRSIEWLVKVSNKKKKKNNKRYIFRNKRYYFTKRRNFK